MYSLPLQPTPSLLSRFCGVLGDLLFPLRCVGCGVYDTLACRRCIVAHLQPAIHDGDAAVHAVITLGLYADPFWRAVVATLKYQAQPRVIDEVGPVFGQVLTELLFHERGVAPSYWCVPVPLHVRRQRERGYNQSTLIAAALAQHSGAVVASQLLRRVVYTESQTVQGVTVDEGDPAADTHSASNDTRIAARLKNVNGTMALYRVPEGVDWSQVHLLLVDDVVTTGATVGEAARALAPLGVASIDVVALARGS